MINLLYTIKETFKDYLNSNDTRFYNIPEYQRGYKWNEDNVEKLLDDIDNFKIDGEKFYCLQNITIVNNLIKNDEGRMVKVYNVVDGQQRLTALTVLLSYLEQQDLIKDKLSYSIRKETQIFINNYILSRSIWNEEEQFVSINNFIDWQKQKANKFWNHQDIYYLFISANTIKNWFSKKEKATVKTELFDKGKFIDKLLNNVKLIINKLDQSNEEKIFGNLNSKRVNLNGADLIRAILITRVAQEQVSKELTTKNIIQINERRARIGWELDEMNRWWSKTESYFNRFISIQEKGGKRILFDPKDYPINNLFLLYAESENEIEMSLDFFEYGHDNDGKKGNDHLEMYKGIIKLHKTLQDWYQDREIYHYLGFLFAYKNKRQIKFKDHIWDVWNLPNKTRQDFCNSLKVLIKESVFGKNAIDKITETGIEYWLTKIRDTKDYNWYEDIKRMLFPILVLNDIIKLSDKKQQNPLPIMESDYFINNSEDKEHIFPQTPISERDKNNKSDLEFKLEKYFTLIATLSENKKLPRSIKVLFNTWKTNTDDDLDDELRTKLRDQTNEYLSKYIDLNSIGNIVLLDFTINRSYGNDFYTDKRREIIRNSQEAKYIRVHTFTSFTKTFSDRMSNLNIWSQSDIEANASYIANKIETFFKE